MNTAVWIAQIVLAAIIGMAGLMKLAQSKETLLASGNMAWTENFTDPQIKRIGTLEVLAAIGLILPPALELAPALTPIAATGVVLLMIGAGLTHLRRGEQQVLPINLLIAAIALFIAIERFGPHSL
jgi:uncharacterized membrane protein YphA (DoxX/SURF4 family)